MTKIEALIREAESIPPDMLDQLLDFARFLKSKHAREKMETAMLSEPALAEDWLAPEEDEAWKDL